MALKVYQVDAFTDKVFSGNPAAICPLQSWLSDELLQKIAMENNLAETGYYVPKDAYYEIRWFTPTIEVDLCGHATLAAAHVLYNHEVYKEKDISFISSRSGLLKVTKEDALLTLNFPADTLESVNITDSLSEILGFKPIELYKGKSDYMAIMENEMSVENYKPNFLSLSKLNNCRGLIITAPGDTLDFVSRFFAPQSGINEDPVTGSAHTSLTPYWSQKLNKKILNAIQLSERKGHLTCTYKGDRVDISGKAVTFLIGEINL